MWRDGEGKPQARPQRPVLGPKLEPSGNTCWQMASEGEPDRFVRAAGRSMSAPAETPSHRAKIDEARRCAQTTSVVQRRLNAKTDSGLTPFHAPSANARPSIQPASRDPGAIAAHTRFPAGTPGGRTPDARDGPWPIRSRR